MVGAGECDAWYRQRAAEEGLTAKWKGSSGYSAGLMINKCIAKGRGDVLSLASLFEQERLYGKTIGGLVLMVY